MKRIQFIILALSLLLCITVTGCGKETISSVLDDAIPKEITSIEVSGFYNGSDLELRELTQEEIDDLNTWLSGLSLKHRTYAEGETPNQVYAGGASYSFNINDGELSFSWVFIDKAYILYEGEWYEITNTSKAPLDYAI